MTVISSLSKTVQKIRSLRWKANEWAMAEYMRWREQGERPRFWKRLLVMLVINDVVYFFLLTVVLAVIVLRLVFGTS